MASTPTPEEQRDRLVFYPVAIVGTLFCVTVLAFVTATMANSPSPVAGWLRRNGTSVLLWETGALVVVAFGAMTLDRLRTRQLLRDSSKVRRDETEQSGDERVG